MIELETDVLIVGSGGAGMYAALEAAKCGASVILADRSLIGRGGGTVMAMMTVAAAVGAQTPDSWEYHLADTLAAGYGLCDEPLSAILCEDGPTRILEMDGWNVGWAREDGHIKQAHAPGHDRPRCVYVDFLRTGPAVSKTLRHQMQNAVGDPPHRRSPRSSTSRSKTASPAAPPPFICRPASLSPSRPRPW